MKNIKKLKQSLQKKKDELNDIPNLECMSFSQFFKYKLLIHNINKLKKQLKKSMLSAKRVISAYEEYNTQILNDMKISCRQYCRKQALAEYKRDIKLHRYGILDKKPIHPLFKPVLKIISIIKKPISNSFRFIKSKFNDFTSKINSQQITKRKILGYKSFEINCRYMKKHLQTNDYMEYLKNIIHEAQTQLSNGTTNPTSSNLSFSQPIHILRNVCPNIPTSTVCDLKNRKRNITFSR